MNAHAIEKVLWDVVNAPATAPSLRDTPAQYLASYNLGADEHALLSNLDAKALISLKINPMLVMRAWQMVHGRDQLPRYIAQLNAMATAP